MTNPQCYPEMPANMDDDESHAPTVTHIGTDFEVCSRCSSMRLSDRWIRITNALDETGAPLRSAR